MTEPHETDHDKETGMRENIGARIVGGARQRPEMTAFDADGKPVRTVVLAEEELGRYWRSGISASSGTGKSSPAAVLLSQIARQGRIETGVPLLRLHQPHMHSPQLSAGVRLRRVAV